jgi:hypothetical protein
MNSTTHTGEDSLALHKQNPGKRFGSQTALESMCDGLAWRVVSPMFDRERPITGAKPYSNNTSSSPH